jgi:hypothetical protein
MPTPQNIKGMLLIAGLAISCSLADPKPSYCYDCTVEIKEQVGGVVVKVVKRQYLDFSTCGMTLPETENYINKTFVNQDTTYIRTGYCEVHRTNSIFSWL